MEAINHYENGNALYEKGRMDDAVAAYREAVQLKPDHSEAHNNLGAALQALGQMEEANAAYREAIRLQRGPMPPPGIILEIACRYRGISMKQSPLTMRHYGSIQITPWHTTIGEMPFAHGTGRLKRSMRSALRSA